MHGIFNCMETVDKQKTSGITCMHDNVRENVSRVSSARKARETRDEVTIEENINKSNESAGKTHKNKKCVLVYRTNANVPL